MKGKDIKGLAVDIDETLSWTVGYWVQEMQKRFGNPENLSVEELIKKYRYTQNVPYWQTKEALAWMEKARGSDELQEEFLLIEQSPAILKKINEIIPITAYITTRPQKIENGTKKWLAKHQFPEAKVLMRPDNIPIKGGNKWKAETLQLLYPGIMGIIDDNPELLAFLPSDYKGTVFLYDNIENNMPTNVEVIPCKNWKSVFEAVQVRFLPRAHD